MSQSIMATLPGWGVVNHLLGVANSDELRTAHQTVQPQVVEAVTKVGVRLGREG